MKHLSVIKKKYERYLEAQKLIQSEDIMNNKKEYVSLSKEIRYLTKLAEGYEEYLRLQKELDSLSSEISKETDDELINLMKSEEEEKKSKIEVLEKELPSSLVPVDEDDGRHCYVEIQGRAGGDEANIFTGDLLEMYQRYFSSIGMTTELIQESRSDTGGFSEVLFAIKSKGAYGIMRGENGIHRVQRVPATETKGRVHTSTAKVIVSPIIPQKDINIKRDDLDIQTFRAGGAGGQHVNKTDSAVRITHIPSGIVAVSQSGRSQHDNKENAMQVIASRLKELQLEQEREKKKDIYKTAGTGDRSEKIRTYNYPQNRVTDHRTEESWLKLDRIMIGDLKDVLNSVKLWREKNILESLVKEN